MASLVALKKACLRDPPHQGFLLPGGPWVGANVPCTRPFEYVYFQSRR